MSFICCYDDVFYVGSFLYGFGFFFCSLYPVTGRIMRPCYSHNHNPPSTILRLFSLQPKATSIVFFNFCVVENYLYKKSSEAAGRNSWKLYFYHCDVMCTIQARAERSDENTIEIFIQRTWQTHKYKNSFHG
jgi:hypothetical protein